MERVGKIEILNFKQQRMKIYLAYECDTNKPCTACEIWNDDNNTDYPDSILYFEGDCVKELKSLRNRLQ